MVMIEQTPAIRPPTPPGFSWASYSIATLTLRQRLSVQHLRILFGLLEDCYHAIVKCRIWVPRRVTIWKYLLPQCFDTWDQWLVIRCEMFSCSLLKRTRTINHAPFGVNQVIIVFVVPGVKRTFLDGFASSSIVNADPEKHPEK